MIYLDPVPAEIDDAYYDRLGRPYYLSPDKLAGDFATVRFERELRILRRYCPPGRLLDVGCSTGAFLHRAKLAFPELYQPTGIEVSGAAIEYARGQGLEIIDNSLLLHDFAGQTFEGITFWAVLEHLVEPLTYLKRAFELLTANGSCVVLVPNIGSLAVRVLGAKYRYILPQHVNYFSRQTLRSLLERAGLEVVGEGSSHFNPWVLLQDWKRTTLAPVPDSERAALLRRTTRWKQSRALTPLKLAWTLVEKLLASMCLADNIWAVGRKRPT